MDENGKSLGITGAIVLACSVVFLAHGSVEMGPGEKESHYEPVVLTITAYSPDEKQTDKTPFEMASGRIVTEEELRQLPFVAASPDVIEKYNIKYGDTVWVPFLVEDTMNEKITETIDIFMRNKELAKKFGRQKRCVIIQIK